MIEIHKFAFQGDCAFIRLDDMPSGLIEQKPSGRVIVAHSETGHHHAIEPGEVKLFEKLERDPFVCYLQLAGESCDVVHHRAWDTHDTLRLLGGAGSIWEVRRQREYVPQGFRRVED